MVGKFWEVAQNRRELLETFASSKGYDPLSAHFWYNFNPIELSSVKVSLSTYFSYNPCFFVSVLLVLIASREREPSGKIMWRLLYICFRNFIWTPPNSNDILVR